MQEPQPISSTCGRIDVATGLPMAAAILALAILYLAMLAWVVALVVTIISFIKKRPERQKHLKILALLSFPILYFILVEILTAYSLSRGIAL
jgi:hypothetical protein